MEEKSKENKKKGSWFSLIKLKIYIIVAVAAAVIISLAYLVRACSDDTVSIVVEKEIDITPTQVLSMKEIREWEFLAIEDEEMVDTVRKGFFSDDHLMRIYYGTLRLGFDLRKSGDNWIEKKADTLHVTLPPITLLDNDFIDEARTVSFFESGKWSDKDRADMYKRAYLKMKNRCLTTENIKSAEANASRQFYQMFRAMGYENIIIRFNNKTQTK